MILSATTDKIQVITSTGTIDVDVISRFTDRNSSTGVIGQADRQLATISSGTTTDIVAAPGATTTRSIREITIRNAHATSSTEVLVQYNANGTLYEMYQARLYPTEMLQYTAREGFKVLSRPERINASRIFHSDGNPQDVVQANAGDTLSMASNLSVTIPEAQTFTSSPLLAGLAMILANCAAATTGFCGDIGAKGRFPTFEKLGAIGTQTISVTAAQLFAGSSSSHLGTVSNTDSGGANVVLNIYAHGQQWGNTTPCGEADYGFGWATEVANSAARIQPGSWFQAFQHTG